MKCKGSFPSKDLLFEHLKELPSHRLKTTAEGKSTTKEDSMFVEPAGAACKSSTVPYTETATAAAGKAKGSSSKGSHSGSTKDKVSMVTESMDSLMMAEKIAIDKAKKKEKCKSLMYSVLSSVAEEPGFVYGGEEPTGEMVTKCTEKYIRGVDRAIQELARMQRVSLCFLLDNTGSMAGSITSVKDNILAIVESIKGTGCSVIAVAFIGYKDWSDGIDHFERLSFTADTEAFTKFVGKITATGGGDGPEDVVGGLGCVSDLTWPAESGTRA